jgi:chlorite dismutase
MPGPLESRKDLMQEAVETGATHVGRIATIVTGAVRDVANEVGTWATDLFEMREASARARVDHEESLEDDAARTAARQTFDDEV